MSNMYTYEDIETKRDRAFTGYIKATDKKVIKKYHQNYYKWSHILRNMEALELMTVTDSQISEFMRYK